MNSNPTRRQRREISGKDGSILLNYVCKALLVASLLLVLIGFHFSYVVISRGGDDYGVDLSHQPPEKNNGSILERNSVNDIVLFSKDDDDVIPADIHPDDAGNKIIGTSIKDGKYQVNQKFLSYLRTLPPFPKKLHIIFPHKDYYRARDPPLPFVKHGVLRFIELNPKWNVTVHDDADVDRLIERAADDGIISVEEKLILVGNETSPGAHPVERGDLARMLLMWYEGGMYVDVDSLINKNFDKVFTPSIKMCISIFDVDNFSQSIVCSSPQNKMFLQIIREMSKIRMTGGPGGGPLERRGGWATGGSLFGMGPPVLNRFVLRRIFGKTDYERGTVPEIGVAKNALLNEAHNTIATGQWLDSCHTFLVDPFDGCRYLNRTELYAMYNISRWGQAVNERWKDPAYLPL